MKRRLSHLFVLTACLTVTGCGVEPTNQANKNTVASPLPSATASPSPAEEAANAELLTLPVLDAFFADESFSESLNTLAVNRRASHETQGTSSLRNG